MIRIAKKAPGKRVSGLIWLAGLLLAAGAGFGAYAVGNYYRGKAVAADAELFVPTGSSFEALMDSLDAGGSLLHAERFGKLARARGLAERVRPGRYQLRSGMTNATLLNMLKGGLQSPVRVTFNNIRTLDRLAGAVSKRLEADSLSILGALDDRRLSDSLGFDRQNFIGMFIPNTYELYWTTSPEAFVLRMKKEYDRFWTPAREARLARTGLDRQQVVTLASIVYEETKLTSEMARVAGVYINRLARRMPLQADPTVKFALGDFAIRRVLHRHLEIDSPYNTYKYAGLPPGPICMPSIAAVDAVLDFEVHDYLYFCARADLSGAHNFARTLAEHNRNAQAYYQALNRLKIR